MPKFITLTEVYEELMMAKPAPAKEDAVITEGFEGVFRFRNNAMIDVFITESDLKNDVEFADVMDNPNREGRIQALQELIVKIIRERFEKCDSTLGVRISAEVKFSDVLTYRTTLNKIIEEYDAKSAGIESP